MNVHKILSIFAVLMASVTISALASPALLTENEPENFEELEIYGRTSHDDTLVRMKRATCDLFSFSSAVFTPNHAACAAHCILLGNRGGQCKGTVCHCRK